MSYLTSSFQEIIERVDTIEGSTLSDEIKLKRSGSLIYQGSLKILEGAKEVFSSLQQQEVEPGDTEIDANFSQFLVSLMQQSISTNFLSKYLLPRPRATYERESRVAVESLLAVEELSELTRNLMEAEVMALAYDENVDAWITLVTNCLETNAECQSLIQIVRATNLSKAQVFLSLLFGDFGLRQDGGFYEGDAIAVKI